MRIYLVTASVNKLSNLKHLLEFSRGKDHIDKVVVIDEGEDLLRKVNKEILREHQVTFYGPKEREEWFKERFGLGYEKYASVIPERCHAEISFAYLVAYEEGADVVIEIDDDVRLMDGNDLVFDHVYNLEDTIGVSISSSNKWYNTIENLSLSTNERLFPRGYPFKVRGVRENHRYAADRGRCVLNMGLWIGCLDLDALTLVYNGALDGRLVFDGGSLKRRKVIISRGTYFPICSMNTSFRRDIIPAFYQLYMNFWGIDRFDDIWSGIFLKKIADHLGDKVCLGAPLVYHDKRPRNVFLDLSKEIKGIELNEVLWLIVDQLNLDGKNYSDAYASLIEGLKSKLDNIDERYRRFLSLQLNKMGIWSEIIDRL